MKIQALKQYVPTSSPIRHSSSAPLRDTLDPVLDDTFYSNELRQVYRLIKNLPYYIVSDNVQTYNNYKTIFNELYSYIFESATQFNDQPLSIPTLSLLNEVKSSSARHDCTPKLFPSARDLLERCDVRPPGPWCVGVIDAVTGQFVHADMTTLSCLEEDQFTDAQGMVVSGDEREDDDQSTDDDAQGEAAEEEDQLDVRISPQSY